jgi:hypothetical protein
VLPAAADRIEIVPVNGRRLIVGAGIEAVALARMVIGAAMIAFSLGAKMWFASGATGSTRNAHESDPRRSSAMIS